MPPLWKKVRGCFSSSLEISRTIIAKLRTKPDAQFFRLYRLGIAKKDEWYQDRSRAALDESIASLSTAVSLYPSSMSDRDNILFVLVDALDKRYRIRNSNDDLQNCISLLRETVELRPPGHLNRSASLNNLANALGARYTRFGDVEDLVEYVLLHQEALTLRPEGNSDHSASLSNLAIALIARYARFGKNGDLEECVRLHRQALTLRPEGHPGRSASLNNLASALNLRYTHFGKTMDLEEQIRLFQEALASQPEGHPDHSAFLSNLAAALSARYARFGDAADLEERALALRPEGHPGRSASLNNLAAAFNLRYTRFGDVKDLEEHIHLFQEALTLHLEGHPERCVSLNNLANAFNARYLRFGDAIDLDEHINLHEQALALRPEGHPDRSISLNNLVNALSARYARFGNIEDLEEHISLHQQSLELRPEGYSGHSRSLSNLAIALSARYARFGDITDLEEHVRLLEEALALHPEGHPDHPASLNNLAVALCDRYARFRYAADLEKCIRLNQQALAFRPEGHPDRVASLNNLAAALSNRHIFTGAITDLEEHICRLREALASQPESNPDRSTSFNNLAAALTIRYAKFEDVADLRERVRLLEQALELRPEGHPNRSLTLSNLAVALSDRYARFRNAQDLEIAISYFRLGSLDIFSPQECSFRWIQVAEKYDHESVQLTPTAQLQYDALLRETRTASLPIDAAAHFIEKGHVEEAIEVLDEGRALLLSEMRRFREPLSTEERARVGNELSSRYLDICRHLRDLSNAEVRFETFSTSLGTASKSDARSALKEKAYGELLKDKRLTMEAYTNLLHQIRQRPFCEDFHRSLKFSELKHAADQGPVVIINCSERRSDVIIVFSDQSPVLISLDKKFYEAMYDTYVGFLDKMSRLNGQKDLSGSISAFLAPIAKQLWSKVVCQVVEALQENGIPMGSRIWWCPTSFLTSLPLYAAGKGSDWLIDHYISSYTTTLSALISARQSGIQEPSSSSPRILVIAQTKTSGLKNAAREPEEMQTLSSFQDCLDEERATPQSVVAHLPGFDWAHFICHGTVADNPFESYLHLHNESRLTLEDIIKPHMADAKFAFVAACHSAAQSRVENALRDEVLHLSAAMQVSGFRSVIGTMWQMEDEDGPRIARKFYEEIFKGSAAVRWLKDECMKEEREKRRKKNVAEGEDGKEDKGIKKGKARAKKKEEMLIARWANYIHIGA